MQKQWIAKTLYGFEELLAAELQHIGAQKIVPANRAVHFEGDQSVMYRANLACRTALKILQPIEHFKARNEKELYEGIYRIDWSEYLQNDQTFAIDATVKSDLFTHSKYVALKTKDALVDQFRNRSGQRPNVDTESPDLRLHIHIFNEQCTVSLDSSGASLHLRGYKTESHAAPISEVMAAGLLLMAGWEGQCEFLDPMCGSGTIPIEAYMIARNIPANIHRREFAFMRWSDFDGAMFKRCRDELMNAIKPLAYPIRGSDKDFSSVKKARLHIDACGYDEVDILQADFLKSEKTTEGDLFILMNPPYDERISVDTQTFYEGIGNTLKRHYAGTEAWMITANQEAIKFIGLKPGKKIKVFNGPLEARLLKFEIYSGSRKKIENDFKI